MQFKQKIVKGMCGYCNWYLKTFGFNPGYPTLIIFAITLLLGANN